MKPKLFIGSSAESIRIAHAAQHNLHHAAEVTVWDQNVFSLSSTSVEALLEALDQTDFAMFVFSPDDEVTIRGDGSSAVRDNVLFELGLFMGRLGRSRSFILLPEGTDLRIATDLLGLTPGWYETGRRDGNWSAATGPACSQIRDRIDRIGPRLHDLEVAATPPRRDEVPERAQLETQVEEKQDLTPEEVRLRLAWLDAYFDRDYDLALKLIDEQRSNLSQDGDEMFMSTWVGRIKYALDPGDGTQYLEQLIEANPHRPEAYAELASLHMTADLYLEALGVLERGLTVVDDPTLATLRADCLKALGRVYEVVETLEQAIARHPMNAALPLALAGFHTEQNDYLAARDCLERANRRMLENEGLLKAYAKLLHDHFEKKWALIPYGKLVRLNPDSAEFLTLRANILLELDLHDSAMRDYQRANELAKGEQGWILGNIGNLYKNRGLYSDAVRYLKKALEREPDSQYAHERLATTLRLSSEEEQKLSVLVAEARNELLRAFATSSTPKVSE